MAASRCLRLVQLELAAQLAAVEDRHGDIRPHGVGERAPLVQILELQRLQRGRGGEVDIREELRLGDADLGGGLHAGLSVASRTSGRRVEQVGGQPHRHVRRGERHGAAVTRSAGRPSGVSPSSRPIWPISASRVEISVGIWLWMEAAVALALATSSEVVRPGLLALGGQLHQLVGGIQVLLVMSISASVPRSWM